MKSLKISITLLAVINCDSAWAFSNENYRDTRLQCAQQWHQFQQQQQFKQLEGIYQHHAEDDVLYDMLETSLKKESLLKIRYGLSIDQKMIQTELNRMFRQSQRPQQLQQLFNAFDNNAKAVAECVVRPRLVDRWWSEKFASDALIHQQQRVEAEQLALQSTHLSATSLEFLPASPMSQTKLRVSLDRYQLMASGNTKAIDIDSDTLFSQLNQVNSDTFQSIKLNTLSENEIQENKRGFSWKRWYADGPEDATVAQFYLPKISADSWLQNQPIADVGLQALTGEYYLQTAASLYNKTVSTGDEGYWEPSIVTDLEGRLGAASFWTGQYMVIWGGYPFNDGIMYEPMTDSIIDMTDTDAPNPVKNFSSVWTGSEMIVWGGYGDYLSNRGGRFNPTTNSWQETSWSDGSLTFMPAARSHHTAVWTGNEMIVWGGYSFTEPTLQGGAVYDPSTDSWSELPDSANAPAGRFNHTAIMAGNEMIIWAGNTAGISNDGARFNVTNQSWASMDNNMAPESRQFHTALWTGDQMIVWGGVDDEMALTSGGLYDPVTDSWYLIDASSVLSTGRYDHSAVWTGDRMIVWGGRHMIDQSVFAGGAMYRPQFDDWTAVTFSAGPAPRSQHVAVWDGESMIVWGGRFSSHRNIHIFHPVTDLIFSQGFELLP